MNRRVWHKLTWVHRVLIAGSVAMMLGLTACNLTSFSETYYTGVVDNDTGAMQFYRFEMEGRAGWTNTKFVSGMYPKEAIDAFVGEEMKDLVPKYTDSKDKDKDDSGTAISRFYTVTGPEGEAQSADDASERLVVIMSSDPEPITKVISEFAKSKAVTNALQAWAKRAAKNDAKKKDTLLDGLKKTIGKLDENDPIRLQAEAFISVLGGGQKGEEG